MKKIIAAGIGLICAFGLGGCNSSEVGSGRPVSAYIGDSVTRINITHHISGESNQWIAENTEVDRLREWASKLKYEVLSMKMGSLLVIVMAEKSMILFWQKAIPLSPFRGNKADAFIQKTYMRNTSVFSGCVVRLHCVEILLLRGKKM